MKTGSRFKWLRVLLENDIPNMNIVYLCNYKIYMNNIGIIIKVTLVRYLVKR